MIPVWFKWCSAAPLSVSCEWWYAMDNHFQAFCSRLSGIEKGLKQLQEAQLHLEQEAGELREHMSCMCLEMVVDLTDRAVEAAMSATIIPKDTEGLWQVREQLRNPEMPLVARCFAAYNTMHHLHQACFCCSPNTRCPLGIANLLLRDLLVLVACVGRGAMDTAKIKACVEEAAVVACGRIDLDLEMSSQLILSYAKIHELGNNQLEFEQKMRTPNMYGPHLTNEECAQLFFVYSSCSRASPKYISMNLYKRKKRQKPTIDRDLGVVRPPSHTKKRVRVMRPAQQ